MKVLLGSILMSFLASLVLGRVVVPLFKSLQFEQPIKTEAPKQHKKKSGTPTLGGFIFIGAAILVYLATVKSFGSETIFLVLTILLFCLIGFLDDTMKLSRKNNDGISSRFKMGLLVLASAVLCWFAQAFLSIGTSITIPFLNRTMELGVFYIPFVLFFYTSLTNSVNLTDGLDGLAASVTLIVLVFLTIISYHRNLSDLSLFCSVLVGALLGFLRYNAFPASIIMGDTGSIALGGAVASISILLGLELVIVIAGGIYVMEALSSLLQIYYFKLTGRRIFKMAPIHHSFELSGMNESKIVSLFTIITAVLCICAYLSLL